MNRLLSSKLPSQIGIPFGSSYPTSSKVLFQFYHVCNQYSTRPYEIPKNGVFGLPGLSMAKKTTRESYTENKIRVYPSNTLPDTKAIASQLIQNMAIEDAFMVSNIGEVIKKHLNWKQCFPRIKPFYAVKCNDDHRVLQTLVKLGTGFDCASKVEIDKVIALGSHPSDIIFANPTKPLSHIRAARTQGVDLMSFDSEVELYKIKQLYPEARLVLRLKCGKTEGAVKFGISVDESFRLLTVAKKLGLNLVGVCFHAGFAAKDPQVFKDTIESARQIFDLAEELGYSFTLLDIGGGFPGHSDLSFNALADVVNSSLDNFFPKDSGVEIIAEPGRYYVTSAFTLIAQVHSIRKIQTNDMSISFMYYVNDGNFGSLNTELVDPTIWQPDTLLEKQFYPPPLFDCSIWGQSSYTADKVYSNVDLPKLVPGQWLVFKNMGSYSLATATKFNGFSAPKVHHVADRETWSFLKRYLGEENFVKAEVPDCMANNLDDHNAIAAVM